MSRSPESSGVRPAVKGVLPEEQYKKYGPWDYGFNFELNEPLKIGIMNYRDYRKEADPAAVLLHSRFPKTP